MDLRSYLELKNLTLKRFGESIGVSHSCVSKWVKNDRMPKQEHMQAIFRVTKGAVTPNDFLVLDKEAG